MKPAIQSADVQIESKDDELFFARALTA